MNNDEFAMEDLDDEKTIAFIKERLPQDLKEKFTSALIQKKATENSFTKLYI